MSPNIYNESESLGTIQHTTENVTPITPEDSAKSIAFLTFVITLPICAVVFIATYKTMSLLKFAGLTVAITILSIIPAFIIFCLIEALAQKLKSEQEPALENSTPELSTDPTFSPINSPSKPHLSSCKSQNDKKHEELHGSRQSLSQIANARADAEEIMHKIHLMKEQKNDKENQEKINLLQKQLRDLQNQNSNLRMDQRDSDLHNLRLEHKNLILTMEKDFTDSRLINQQNLNDLKNLRLEAEQKNNDSRLKMNQNINNLQDNLQDYISEEKNSMLGLKQKFADLQNRGLKEENKRLNLMLGLKQKISDLQLRGLEQEADQLRKQLEENENPHVTVNNFLSKTEVNNPTVNNFNQQNTFNTQQEQRPSTNNNYSSTESLPLLPESKEYHTYNPENGKIVPYHTATENKKGRASHHDTSSCPDEHNSSEEIFVCVPRFKSENDKTSFRTDKLNKNNTAPPTSIESKAKDCTSEHSKLVNLLKGIDLKGIM